MPTISICKQCKTKLATNGELCNFCIEENNEEFEKCKANPYYFMTKYWKVDGKPFVTDRTEQEFNNFFNSFFKPK